MFRYVCRGPLSCIRDRQRIKFNRNSLYHGSSTNSQRALTHERARDHGIISCTVCVFKVKEIRRFHWAVIKQMENWLCTSWTFFTFLYALRRRVFNSVINSSRLLKILKNITPYKETKQTINIRGIVFFSGDRYTLRRARKEISK